MEAAGLLGMLGICSYEDIKGKRVGVVFILCFAILGIVIHLFLGSRSIGEIIGGMVVGGFLFLISIISGERIGKGDALMVTVSGIYLGFWNNLFLFWVASIFSGVAGLVFLFKGRKNEEIPFAPFLLGVYLLSLIMEVVPNVS